MSMIDAVHRTLKRRWMTPLDALQLCGCLSLSQRCGQLRRAGVNVIDKWVSLPSGKRVKSYRIPKDQPCYFFDEGSKARKAMHGR